MRVPSKWFLGVAACVALMFLASMAVRAQTQLNVTGTVLGHVKDPSGAAIPGAKVTLHNEQTGISQTFTTSATGDYLFINQIPDTYDVTVKKTGFKTASTTGLILQVEQTLRQDFTLQVGSTTQQVTVSAQAPMLQTDNATIGSVVNSRTLSALPLNGRDYTTLININAGVTEPSGGIRQSTFDQHGLNPTWSESSVDGQRPEANSYLIDGITDTDLYFSKDINLVSADAIQEFKLQNGLYSAAYGTGAAQINVALKSGTNQLHGTAYDYWENEALQPASLINKSLNDRDGGHRPVVAPFNQNQFGFTLGGPVVIPKIYNGRDRTFWFVGYEGGRRIFSGTGASETQVPTTKERSGDFSDWPFPIYDPATTGQAPVTKTNPAGRLAFANNAIPSSLFGPFAQKWLKYFPAPTSTCTMPCDNYSAVVSFPTTTDTVNVRADHQLTDRDHLTPTVIISRDIATSPSLFPDSSFAAFTRTRLAGLDYIHNISPTSINDFRFGFDREFFHEGALTAYGPNLSAQLGFANTTSLAAFYGLPGLTLGGGYGTPGIANNGYTQKENIFQWVDNYTLIHGKHTLTAGADIRRYQLQQLDGFQANGVVNFTGAYTASNPLASGRAGPTAGNGFADFLLGDPFSITPPVPFADDLENVRSTDWNFFIQDDFRVTPRLTMNVGLRYEIPEQLHSITNDGATISLNTPGGGYTWASKSFTNLFASASNASTYFQCCISNQLLPTHYKDLSPRFGVAWRPLRNNDRLVLRAGYGIFYEGFMRFYDLSNYASNQLFLLQSNPNYPENTGFESASKLQLSKLWLPPIAVTANTIPPAYQFNIQTEWPQNKDPYNQQWTLDTQYQFTPTMMVDVGYVGAHALHMPLQWEFNQAFPPAVAGDPCNRIATFSLASPACKADPNFQPADSRVPYSNMGLSSYANANLLWSNYNALQVRVEKRFSQGLQFNANYTWSRTFDAGISEIQAFTSNFSIIQQSHNLKSEYGPAAYDEPQRFVLSYLYEDPIGRGRKYNLGLANWILGGWETSGILNLGSGVPFTIYCCPRSNPINQFGFVFGDALRPNLVGNFHLSSGQQSYLQWFNPSAFADPEAGRFGNGARNLMRGPSMHQIDLSFMKDFHITERNVIQYRLDIFNAFSSRYAFNAPHIPDSRLSDSPVNCVPGPAGTCHFGSLVPLNGIGATDLWNPRVLQMSLRYIF